ncbi:hypothetical protein ACWV26_18995 [Rummeliibacillus sp. JY-2-4R]
MKSRKFIFPIILATSLGLAACNGANTNNTTKEEQSSNVSKTALSISDGAKEMQQTIKDLKTQIEEKDATQAKVSGENLEKTWQKFEDGVKEKNADLYGKVETPLHLIEAGVKSQPLDATTLNKAADELNSVLSEVGKLK